MIRKAEEKDLPVLLKLAFEFHKAARLKRLASFEDSISSWEEWIKSCIASDTHLCLIAEKDNKPAGFLTGVIFPAYWNKNVHAAHECTIWVCPDARSNGVGSALLDDFVAWGIAKGATIVSSGSTVYMGPKEMGSLLRKHGFSLEERTYSKRVG